MKDKLDKTVQHLHQILFTNRQEWALQRLIAYSLVIILAVYLSFMEQDLSKTRGKGPLENIGKFNTMIPKGFTLIPVEIANSKNLDSMLGSHAVVDLFYRDPQTPKVLKPVARQVRILRAPKNPNIFAVLCKRTMTSAILKYPGPFQVTLLSDKESGMQIVKPKRKSRIHIDFIDET